MHKALSGQWDSRVKKQQTKIKLELKTALRILRIKLESIQFRSNFNPKLKNRADYEKSRACGQVMF